MFIVEIEVFTAGTESVRRRIQLPDEFGPLTRVDVRIRAMHRIRRTANSKALHPHSSAQAALHRFLETLAWPPAEGESDGGTPPWPR